MLKAVIENNGKRAYFDFCTHKGYDVVMKALKRIGYKDTDFYSVKAEDVNLHFTNQTERFHEVQKLIQPKTKLHDIFIACQTLMDTDKFLMAYIKEKFQNNEITSIIDVRFHHQVYNIKKLDQEHPSGISNPNELTYDPILIFDKKALYTPNRIDRSQIPEGVYIYETMCDDGFYGDITMLGKTIHVNFWGTILTTHKIALDNGYRQIDEEKDIDFLSEPYIKLKEFLERNPPKKNKEFVR